MADFISVAYFVAMVIAISLRCVCTCVTALRSGMYSHLIILIFHSTASTFNHRFNHKIEQQSQVPDTNNFFMISI